MYTSKRIAEIPEALPECMANAFVILVGIICGRSPTYRKLKVVEKKYMRQHPVEKEMAGILGECESRAGWYRIAFLNLEDLTTATNWFRVRNVLK